MRKDHIGRARFRTGIAPARDAVARAVLASGLLAYGVGLRLRRP